MNLHLYATSSLEHFSGIYQDPENPFLTFRYLVHELRLSFRDDENWNGVAFGLDQRNRSHGFPLFGTERKLDAVIASLASPHPVRRAVVRYYIMRHSGCHLAENSPLGEHYKASCATFIPHQTRRNDPRYIVPSASLSNEQQLIQSRKRKLSASASLDKDTEGANKMIRPVSGLVDRAKVREITDSFSTNVMVSIKLCAVTGSGRRWCTGQRIGPSLEVCQIVPSQHFHVYPTGDNSQDMGRRLVQAWHDIWDFKNVFLFRSDIRELFDARLISIYPDTHRIRAFVPYDVTLKYHGRIATIPRNVDRDALAHHYEMACIENMTAMMPIRGSTTLPSTVVRGPFLLPTAHADLPAPPGQPSRSPRRLATGSTAQGLTRPSTP